MAPTMGTLAGRRVAVTRATAQAADLLEQLRSRGAEAIPCPTIAVEPPASYAPLDAALRRLDGYDWVVFTSANGVAAFADRAAATGVVVPASLRIAAVGAATASALAVRVRAPDFVPREALAEVLAAELDDVAERRVLFPRGELAGDAVRRVLRERGATVDDVVAYRTVAGAGANALAQLVRDGAIDAILFMSPSSVRHLADALEGVRFRSPAVVCIGPETARAARESGLEVSAVAADRSVSGIVEALEQWFGRDGDGEGG